MKFFPVIVLLVVGAHALPFDQRATAMSTKSGNAEKHASSSARPSKSASSASASASGASSALCAAFPASAVETFKGKAVKKLVNDTEGLPKPVSNSSSDASVAACPKNGSSKAKIMTWEDDELLVKYEKTCGDVVKKRAGKKSAVKKAARSGTPTLTNISEISAPSSDPISIVLDNTTLSKLDSRASWNHPSIRDEIYLYHATKGEHFGNIFDTGLKIPQSRGQFSFNGALYMTDRPMPAAQFIKALYPKVRQIVVMKYRWTPFHGMRVVELDRDNDDNQDRYDEVTYYNWRLHKQHPPTAGADVITGPMTYVEGVTNGFWQYAFQKPRTLNYLEFVEHHVYDRCDVPLGKWIPYLRGFKDSD